jgi:hypothetical protein
MDPYARSVREDYETNVEAPFAKGGEKIARALFALRVARSICACRSRSAVALELPASSAISRYSIRRGSLKSGPHCAPARSSLVLPQTCRFDFLFSRRRLVLSAQAKEAGPVPVILRAMVDRLAKTCSFQAEAARDDQNPVKLALIFPDDDRADLHMPTQRALSAR